MTQYCSRQWGHHCVFLAELLMHAPFWMQDHEMQRGKPLYLSQERYAALTYLVTVCLPFPLLTSWYNQRCRWHNTLSFDVIIGGISQPWQDFWSSSADDNQLLYVWLSALFRRRAYAFPCKGGACWWGDCSDGQCAGKCGGFAGAGDGFTCSLIDPTLVVV